MQDLVKRYVGNVSGASAVEYALFMGLVGLAVIGGAKLFTGQLYSQWEFTENTFKNSVQ